MEMDSGWILLLFILVGFLAQLIDGALGMAYGLVSTSVLLALGMPPAQASAAVHAAEMVTTGISGSAHAWFGNIDRRLLWRLVLPGMAGGIVGALLASHLPADYLRPAVLAYLLAMGGFVLWRALRPRPLNRQPRLVPAIGSAAGFLDALGGGGWGPMATSSLLAQGASPRYTIGSVNAAEFFVTTAITAAFVSQLGLDFGLATLGLLLGGGLAAPLAAWVVTRVPRRALLLLVGVLIVVMAAVQLVLLLR
ncbi:MAG: sulfite exporter TauE/SafE family protein [Xanthomonadales bacterium]|nr:sulfite exporter TauE/SafE family protein [Xanthomonadales bacterium]